MQNNPPFLTYILQQCRYIGNYTLDFLNELVECNPTV